MDFKQALAATLEDERTLLATSSEEDSLLFDEVTSSLLSNNRDLDELHRLHDVHQGLVDMASLVQAIPRCSVENLAFMQVASNLATAGSSYDASLLFPSLESLKGQHVSTESITEVAQRLWERIVRVLKALINAFKQFWTNVADAGWRMRKAAERLRLRANAANGRPIRTGTITVHREIDRLSIRGSTPNNGEEIYRGLVNAKGQLKIVLNDYVGNVITTGQNMQTALSGDFTNPEQYLQGVINASKGLRLPFIASSLGCKEYRDVRFAAGEVMAAPPLLGNKSLFVTPLAVVRRDSASLLAQAEAQRRVGVRLLDSEPRNFAGHIDYQLPTIPAKTVAQLADAVIEICAEIDSFVKASRKRQLESQYSKLLDVSGKAKNKIYERQVTESDSRHYESALRFNAAFASWSENPHDSLVTHLLGVCRAALVVGNKSISNHS